MKINDCGKTVVLFSELNCGDVFEYHDAYYMKIHNDYNPNSEYNVIDLAFGLIDQISDQTMVTKRTAELNLA